MICKVCKIEKPVEDFYQRKDRKSPRTRCKKCDAVYLKEFRAKNKDNFTAWTRQYNQKNKDRINARRRARYPTDKCAKDAQKRWKEKNREKAARLKREGRIRNRQKNSEVHKIRWQTDINYRMRSNLRSRLKMAMKSRYKTSSAKEYLGCSIPDFIKYIEAQFKEGMTWENWGQFGWHLDHIRPLASFDLSDPEQVARASHYTNFQPLWWQENLSKNAKYNGEI